MKVNKFTEQTYFILLALAAESLHGYGIIKKVEVLSDGQIVLAAGTLYGVLENLKKTSLIEQMQNQEDTRRKMYRITELGKQTLLKEYTKLQQRCFISKQILEKGE